MRVDRQFRPLLIVMETPEEVARLEQLLREVRDTYVNDAETLGPQQALPAERAAGHALAVELLRELDRTVTGGGYV